jgi:hypothetical protein
MKPIAIALAATAILGAAGAAQAAPSPFAGTWKVDLAKSHLAGDTVTYAKTAKGYTSTGGAMSYAFAVDGKDYPSMGDRTTAWAKAADGGWDETVKAGGKVIDKAHRTISADGKSMTITGVETRPDGTTATDKDVYTRVSGTSGLAGEWRSVKVQGTSDVETISTPTPGAFRLEDATYKQTIAGKLDGSTATVTGPTMPPGATATYKAKGPAVWEYTFGLKGKTIGQGVMKVAADGRSMTDTSWAPGKADEKSVTYYVKQ